MYSLLLVDDEIATLEGLAVNPWESLGISCVYKAHSTVEAMETIKENSVDIVVTDIRMPGESGIELIRKIDSLSKGRTKCILLSGYAEFEYAKAAIQHRAFDYLLKPVSDDSLMDTVKKAIDVLEKEAVQHSTFEQAIQTIEENQGLLRGDFVRELVENRILNTEQLKKRLKVLNLSVDINDPFFLLLIKLENGFLDYDVPNESVLEYAITNMAQETFSEQYEICKYRDVHGYLVFMMFVKHPSKSLQGKREAKQQVESLAAKLSEEVNRDLKGDISYVISNLGTFPNEVSNIYQANVTSLSSNELSLIKDAESMLEDDYDATQIHFLYEPPLLIHLLETNRWDLIKEKLEDLFNELIDKKLTTKEYKMEVFFMISNSFSYFANKSNRNLFQIIGENFKKMIHIVQIGNLEQFKEVTLTILGQLKKEMTCENSGDIKSVIHQTQEYVHKQLDAGKNVSLQEIADLVYLHPAYLSKIYKVKTGEGFSDYVHRMKMEKAANLLEGSNEKINKIARKLGFQQTSYFIRVFKKYFNVTPLEYRKKENSLH